MVIESLVEAIAICANCWSAVEKKSHALPLRLQQDRLAVADATQTPV